MTGHDPYRIRDFVPDFAALSAELAARSRALPPGAVLREGLAYGPGPRQVLDLILPLAPARDAPLHLFIHGGYWRAGDRVDTRCVAAPVLAAGGIAAIVEYDLMPEARLATLVAQVRAALCWLVGQASAIGADPARITASGHSAGAHLASYLAADAPGQGTVLPALQGLLLLSGIYDLREIPHSFLRDETRMTDAEAALWSPLAASHHPGPTRLVALGADETAPFHDQAAALAALVPGARLRAEPGLNHISVMLDLSDPARPLGAALAEMVAA